MKPLSDKKYKLPPQEWVDKLPEDGHRHYGSGCGYCKTTRFLVSSTPSRQARVPYRNGPKQQRIPNEGPEFVLVNKVVPCPHCPTGRRAGWSDRSEG